MRKLTFVLAGLMLCWLSIEAQQRSQSEALKLAAGFMNSLQESEQTELEQAQLEQAQAAPSRSGAQSLQPVQSTQSLQSVQSAQSLQSVAAVQSASGQSASAFYIFNDTQANRAVVISGDERMPEVLGYMPDGMFNADDAPDALLWLLDWYRLQYDMLQTGSAAFETPAALGTPAVLEASAALGTPAASALEASAAREPLRGGAQVVVEPLIKTHWNQYYPYNKYCPKSGNNATLVGCLAISMAQVMNYYGYPDVGSGSISYTTASDGLSVSWDFTDTRNFDWDNLLESYEYNFSTAQADAVARLCSACGASLGMDYTIDFSSSYYSDIPYAMVNNFGYAPSAAYYERDYFTNEAWKAMLKDELLAGRPVMYGGQDNVNGGHSFLLDGFRSDDMFHVNWGWGFGYDGYFSLDALKPGGNYYEWGHSAIVGVSPELVEQPAYPFVADVFGMEPDCVEVTPWSYVMFTMDNCYNVSSMSTSVRGDTYFTGSLGVAAYSMDDVFQYVLCSFDVTEYRLVSWYGFTSCYVYADAMDIDLELGEKCKLVPVSIHDDCVTRIPTMGSGTDYIVACRTDQNTITFSSKADYLTSVPMIYRTPAQLSGKRAFDVSGRQSGIALPGIRIIDGKKYLE